SIEDLLSATVTPISNQILYQFDKPIVTGSVIATNFFVVLADGEKVFAPAGSATIGSATTVAVTFPGLNWANEFAVGAGVTGDAVQAEGPGGTGPPFPTGTSSKGGVITNSPGAVPFGGNAGASSQGYTSGPDMYAVQFNSAGSVVTMDFDSRISNCNPHGLPLVCNLAGGIKFYNAQGSEIGNGLIENVVIPNDPNPETTQVTLDVDPALFAQHPTSVQITGDGAFPFLTPGGLAFGDGGTFCTFQDDLGNAAPNAPGTPVSGGSEPNTAGCSAPQIVASTTTAAHLKSEKKVSKKSKKHHTTKKAKKVVRKH
ncbi:MAG TPA: hypothetical protein VG223_14280, partial [Solirubrobacteraceae bacterium]|nr:hypothetical protein [Solirubrobacteraceae bacterium]